MMNDFAGLKIVERREEGRGGRAVYKFPNSPARQVRKKYLKSFRVTISHDEWRHVCLRGECVLCHDDEVVKEGVNNAIL